MSFSWNERTASSAPTDLPPPGIDFGIKTRRQARPPRNSASVEMLFGTSAKNKLEALLGASASACLGAPPSTRPLPAMNRGMRRSRRRRQDVQMLAEKEPCEQIECLRGKAAPARQGLQGGTPDSGPRIEKRFGRNSPEARKTCRILRTASGRLRPQALRRLRASSSAWSGKAGFFSTQPPSTRQQSEKAISAWIGFACGKSSLLRSNGRSRSLFL